MQLKVDKLRLMEICGTSDTEFGNVSLELQFACITLSSVRVKFQINSQCPCLGCSYVVGHLLIQFL